MPVNLVSIGPGSSGAYLRSRTQTITVPVNIEPDTETPVTKSMASVPSPTEAALAGHQVAAGLVSFRDQVRREHQFLIRPG